MSIDFFFSWLIDVLIGKSFELDPTEKKRLNCRSCLGRVEVSSLITKTYQFVNTKCRFYHLHCIRHLVLLVTCLSRSRRADLISWERRISTKINNTGSVWSDFQIIIKNSKAPVKVVMTYGHSVFHNNCWIVLGVISSFDSVWQGQNRWKSSAVLWFLFHLLQGSDGTGFPLYRISRTHSLSKNAFKANMGLWGAEPTLSSAWYADQGFAPSNPS